MIKKSKKKIAVYFLVIFIFLIFTILNTYPLIKHLTTHQLGDGGDGPEFMWDLWWMKKALTNLQNPYYTDYLFYPNGSYLYLHTLIPFTGTISILLQYLFGNLILVYNIIAIFNLVLTGFSMFLLAFYLTKNKFASIIAGYIFTFSPYMIGHTLGHLNLMLIWPIPLFILFFIKFHYEQSFKNMFFSIFFLILLTLDSLYYGVFMLLFSFIYECFFLCQKPWFKDPWHVNTVMVFDHCQNSTSGSNHSSQTSGILKFKKFNIKRDYILKLFGIFLIYLLILSPLFLGILSSIFSRKYASNWDTDYWSADVFTLFIPGTLAKSKMLFENANWWQRIMTNSHVRAENQNFLGYTVLILAFIGIFTTFKKKTNREDKNILFNLKFWIILAVIGFIFALGTKLKFFGYTYDIKLPYYYIYKVLPLVSVPGRFVLLVFISLAILSAFGIKNISENLSVKKKYLFCFLIFLLVIGEFLAVPYPITTYKVSEFYYQLKDEKGDFAIHDLSHRDASDYFRAAGFHMYYQTIHNKKITDGRISRNNLATLNYAKNGPPTSDFKKLNIKYVICSKNSTLCENFTNYPIVYDDEDIYVHRIF